MTITIDAIKSLREKTGAPLSDVRQALEKAGGDEAKAKEILKQKGFEAARKRQGRATSVGRIGTYVHHDGRVAALVEINCETDFVARTPEFSQFCGDVAMQVASQNPLHVAKEELKAAEHEAKDVCLLEQAFIKDAGQSIGDLLTALIGKTGENIVIKRFKRFAVGEEIKA